MPAQISALERKPLDLVREVSPEAITFYVDELSGIYLPDEFRASHADVFDVKYWKPEDRLEGKFGRFALRAVQEGNQEEPLDGILVMGTTIGLSGLDTYGHLASLRHYTLNEKIRGILEERDLLGRRIAVDRADYGSTTIKLDGDSVVAAVNVDSTSIDFGRANTEGRQETCEMFAQLLGDGIQVINAAPEPRDHDKIVD